MGEINLYMRVLAHWRAMSESARVTLAPHLLALHGGTIEKGSPLAAREARDAVFELRDGLSGEHRALADAALVKAVTRDLRDGRISEGRHTVPKIAAQLGPAVFAPAAEAVLADPAAPFAPTVEVVTKLDDHALKEKAGAALVNRVNAKPEQPKELWAALVSLGGPQVTELLKTRVRSANEADALAAAHALKAGKPDPQMISFALEIAGNANVAAPVREEMFTLLETMATPETVPRLLKIVASDVENPVRLRAFAAALAVGKGEAVRPGLEAFPAAAPITPEELSQLLAVIAKSGEGARPAALAALGSTAALARLVGVLSLEEVGLPEDGKLLASHARDKAQVPGLPRDLTIGKAAARVAAVVKAKKPPPTN